MNDRRLADPGVADEQREAGSLPERYEYVCDGLFAPEKVVRVGLAERGQAFVRIDPPPMLFSGGRRLERVCDQLGSADTVADPNRVE